ncbi:GNAT family N-acetyltransferase [Zooshikella harenae]|uniref:GNAT family N-acetyltransferase n=1 Tax=Zooshikella harenae TaxID=2827238 RepID=A0ABS5ZHI1_9GAMM|nr:GNAT family N-acetyltransferase [Zooshikella harenae]MBU2713524.1 GNAT family N-acetyltransferase [Zooshikella harenae]
MNMKEYLDLTKLTLNSISIEAGRPIDDKVYLGSLGSAKKTDCLFDVYNNKKLLAYATLKDLGEGRWFVLMFVIHPSCRHKKVFIELFYKIIKHLISVKAKILVSNVFKVNKRSVVFHKKLGFKVTREADIGYEYTLALDNLDNLDTSKWWYWARKFPAKKT